LEKLSAILQHEVTNETKVARPFLYASSEVALVETPSPDQGQASPAMAANKPWDETKKGFSSLFCQSQAQITGCCRSCHFEGPRRGSQKLFTGAADISSRQSFFVFVTFFPFL
jgi:hypothetical protein